MGEGTHRMTGFAPTPLEPEKPRQIEREIDDLRAQLDALVGELERRRHHAFDWRHQLRRHPARIAVGAGATVVALVLAARHRPRPSLGEQIATLLRGVYAVGENPQSLERADDGVPALAIQLARTAALAGASVLVRRLTRRALGEVS